MMQQEENALLYYSTDNDTSYPISEMNAVLHADRDSAIRYAIRTNNKGSIYKCALLDPIRKVFDIKKDLHKNILCAVMPGSIMIKSNIVIMSNQLIDGIKSNEFDQSLLNEKQMMSIIKKQGFIGHTLYLNDGLAYVLYEPLNCLNIIEEV